ncbi:MAG: hypothetical protein V1831_00470 [Candidatus Woesearchaeota archaeon]
MEIKIIGKKEDPLLSRTKVEVEIIFESATPSREEIKSRLGKDLGKNEKLIVVKGIYTDYGLKKAKNIAYVYENEDALNKIETGKKGSGKKKKGVKEEDGEAEKESKPEAKQEKKPKEAVKKEGK